MALFIGLGILILACVIEVTLNRRDSQRSGQRLPEKRKRDIALARRSRLRRQVRADANKTRPISYQNSYQNLPDTSSNPLDPGSLPNPLPNRTEPDTTEPGATEPNTSPAQPQPIPSKPLPPQEDVVVPHSFTQWKEAREQDLETIHLDAPLRLWTTILSLTKDQETRNVMKKA
jgi:hypothetical protein